MYHATALPALAIHDFSSNLTLRSGTQTDLKSLVFPLTPYRSANLCLQSLRAPFTYSIDEPTKDLGVIFGDNGLKKFYDEKGVVHLS